MADNKNPLGRVTGQGGGDTHGGQDADSGRDNARVPSNALSGSGAWRGASSNRARGYMGRGRGGFHLGGLTRHSGVAKTTQQPKSTPTHAPPRNIAEDLQRPDEVKDMQPEYAEPAAAVVLAHRMMPPNEQAKPAVPQVETGAAKEKEKPAEKAKTTVKRQGKARGKTEAPVLRSLPDPETMQRLWREVRPRPIGPVPGFRPFEWPVHEGLPRQQTERAIKAMNKYYIQWKEYVEARLMDRGDSQLSVLLAFFGDDIEDGSWKRQLVICEVRQLATILSNWCADCRVKSSTGHPPTDLHTALYVWKMQASSQLLEPAAGEIVLQMLDKNEPIHRPYSQMDEQCIGVWAKPIFEGQGSAVDKARQLVAAAHERPIQNHGRDDAPYTLRVALQLWFAFLETERHDMREMSFVKHILMLEDRGWNAATLDKDMVLEASDDADNADWPPVGDTLNLDGCFTNPPS